MRFLDAHLRAGTVSLRDLSGGWPDVVKRLSEEQSAEAQALLSDKRTTANELMEALEE